MKLPARLRYVKGPVLLKGIIFGVNDPDYLRPVGGPLSQDVAQEPYHEKRYSQSCKTSHKGGEVEIHSG